MAGRKLFTNHTDYSMNVTLVIRRSANPKDTAGTKDFTLQSRQSAWQGYGNDNDIFLNGIKLVAFLRQELIGQQYIVIERASELDNRLNMFNAVDFGWANATFYLTTREVR